MRSMKRFDNFSIALCKYVMARTKEVALSPKPAVVKWRSKARGYRETGRGLEEWYKSCSLYYQAEDTLCILESKRSALISIDVYEKWDDLFDYLNLEKELPRDVNRDKLNTLRDTLYYLKGIEDAHNNHEASYGFRILLDQLAQWEKDYEFNLRQRRSNNANDFT